MSKQQRIGKAPNSSNISQRAISSMFRRRNRRFMPKNHQSRSPIMRHTIERSSRIEDDEYFQMIFTLFEPRRIVDTPIRENNLPLGEPCEQLTMYKPTVGLYKEDEGKEETSTEDSDLAQLISGLSINHRGNNAKQKQTGAKGGGIGKPISRNSKKTEAKVVDTSLDDVAKLMTRLNIQSGSKNVNSKKEQADDKKK